MFYIFTLYKENICHIQHLIVILQLYKTLTTMFDIFSEEKEYNWHTQHLRSILLYCSCTKLKWHWDFNKRAGIWLEHKWGLNVWSQSLKTWKTDWHWCTAQMTSISPPTSSHSPATITHKTIRPKSSMVISDFHAHLVM